MPVFTCKIPQLPKSHSTQSQGSLATIIKDFLYFSLCKRMDFEPLGIIIIGEQVKKNVPLQSLRELINTNFKALFFVKNQVEVFGTVIYNCFPYAMWGGGGGKTSL